MQVSPLVSFNWVADQIRSKATNLRILDASWHSPNAKRDPLEEYQQKHIPGAQFFNIDCAKPGDRYSHMLPSEDVFSEYVGSMGIDNDTHVVVYENNAKFGAFSAPRAWWLFRVFGHFNVSILDGGLPVWMSKAGEVTDKIPQVTRAVFKASYKPDLFKSFADIQSNLEEKTFQVMDARPAGFFTGTVPDPRKGIESGHMPNSTSVPFTTMLKQMDGGLFVFKSPDELKKTFKDAGLDLTQPIIASCGSGVNACIVAFGAYVAGKEDVPVFNGAWEEYYLKMKDINPENILKD